MKRRSFGSIGGRVDATLFLLFVCLSLCFSGGVVARVYVIREGAPFEVWVSEEFRV